MIKTIICSADKGKAIVIEDKDTYLAKMQQQFDLGDNKLEKRKEKHYTKSFSTN